VDKFCASEVQLHFPKKKKITHNYNMVELSIKSMNSNFMTENNYLNDLTNSLI